MAQSQGHVTHYEQFLEKMCTGGYTVDRDPVFFMHVCTSLIIPWACSSTDEIHVAGDFTAGCWRTLLVGSLGGHFRHISIPVSFSRSTA